jgi:hypothetical protein
MGNASRLNKPTPPSVTTTTPPVSAADQLAPVLAEILSGLRDLRDLLTGVRKEWCTVEEVAGLTGRTPYTVRRWVQEYRIEATRVSGTGPRGRLLIAHGELRKLIAAGTGGEIPAAVGE